MKPISRLVVSLAVLVGVTCGTTANAQIEAPTTNFTTDPDPKLQSRASILEAFDVDTSKLPKGTSINRVRRPDGSIDELRLSVPAQISVRWQAPVGASVTCDIKLIMVRTGVASGANGQPPNSQHVYSSGVVAHWAGAFWMPIRNGKISASNPVEWPDEGYPNAFAGESVVVPSPTCDAIHELGFTITPNDPPYKEEYRSMKEAGVPEAQIQQALQMMLNVGGRNANPFAKTVSWDEYQRLSCFSRAFPVRDVIDGNPENFLMRFEGRVEDEDMPDCPLSAASGYIHVGDVPKGEFLLLRSLPEPEEAVTDTGDVFSCTNNDPIHPLVRFEFSTDVDPRSLYGNAFLEVMMPGGDFEPIEADFEVSEDTNIVLDPSMTLEPLHTYRVTLIGGENGIQGMDEDDFMPDDVAIVFETAAGTDNASFKAMLGKEVDTGIYQVVRDAALTPGKRTYARTLASYPGAGYTGRADKLNADMCLNIEVRSKDNGPAIAFSPKVHNYKREDLVTKDDRRMGLDKALSSGWSPAKTDRFGSGRKFETRITPFNFTSAIEDKDPPELLREKPKSVDILPNEIWLPIKVYSGIINMQWDEAVYDKVSALNVFSNLPSMRDTYKKGNEDSPKLARLVMDDKARISRTLAEYLPTNGATFGMSPHPVEIDIDMFFPLPSMKPGDDEAAAFVSAMIGFSKYHGNLAEFIQQQSAYTLKRKVLRNCRGLEICVMTVPYAIGGAQAQYDASQISRGLIMGVDTLYRDKNKHKLPLGMTHEIGHDFGLAHAPNDFNSLAEQNRIAALLDDKKVRWPGIDAIRPAQSGIGMAYFSSEYGNSQSHSLWPTMYMTLVNPHESAMPTDQYEQITKALINPNSANPAYFGAHQNGATSSRVGINDINWRANNSRYEPGTDGPATAPEFAFATDTADGQDGILVSVLLALREDGTTGSPFMPDAEAARMEQTSPLNDWDGPMQAFTLTALDKSGTSIASTSVDIPAFDLATGFSAARLTAFLPLDSEDQGQVAAVIVANANNEIVTLRKMEGIHPNAIAADVEVEPVPEPTPEAVPSSNARLPVEPVSPEVIAKEPAPASPSPPAAPAASGARLGSCGMSEAEVKQLVDHQLSALESMSGVTNLDQLKAELLASYLAPDYPKDNLCEMRKELPGY